MDNKTAAKTLGNNPKRQRIPTKKLQDMSPELAPKEQSGK